MDEVKRKTLLWLYETLLSSFGPQGWWPAETPFEVIVGAVLTQNTSWKNVERAIDNLKKAAVLSPSRLSKLTEKKLAKFIRSAGYYNVKAKRLKNVLTFLNHEYGGDLSHMCSDPLAAAREKILAVKGIGPETADSILLYAAGKPIFVIDAYTRRVLSRHAIVTNGATYENIQTLFMQNLPHQLSLFKEFHALFVRLAKTYCKATPVCRGCPLESPWPMVSAK
jgi:endonuclease-3 related protein